MPAESIATYVNNVISFAVFIIILAFIFTLLVLMSRFFTRRNLMRDKIEGIGIKDKIHLTDYPLVREYKKDPYLRKNAFILGAMFVIVISFIILIFAVVNYSINPSLNLNLFLIIGILFYLTLMVIFIIKSEIIC